MDESLQRRSSLFTGGNHIRLFIGSFNVGNAQVTSLDGWIPQHGGDYDIIVVGLQESTFKMKRKSIHESKLALQRMRADSADAGLDRALSVDELDLDISSDEDEETIQPVHSAPLVAEDPDEVKSMYKYS